MHHLYQHDEAENSIMQTISIAVSAILIAAGLITAPSLINNARDVNAKTDLANLSYAQEAALADTGHYYQNLNRGEAKSLADYKSPETGKALVRYTTSGDVFNVAVACDSAFVLKTTSQSGKTFYRTSESTKITDTAPSMAASGLDDCYDGDATKVEAVKDRLDTLTNLDTRAADAVKQYADVVAADGTSPVTGGTTAPGTTAPISDALPSPTINNSEIGSGWNSGRTFDATTRKGLSWTLKNAGEFDAAKFPWAGPAANGADAKIDAAKFWYRGGSVATLNPHAVITVHKNDGSEKPFSNLERNLQANGNYKAGTVTITVSLPEQYQSEQLFTDYPNDGTGTYDQVFNYGYASFTLDGVKGNNVHLNDYVEPVYNPDDPQ